MILAHDVWKAMWFEDAAGGASFGIGIGTLVLAVNVVFLGSYTLSCHSLRHLIGGCEDRRISSSRFAAYRCATCLNRRHMLFAWASLVWVGFSDLYVRMLSMGMWTDVRLI